MREANEERGEVNLVCGAKTYVLRLTHQAICEAQARTGRTWAQLLLAMDEDMVAYRDVLSVMLKPYHAKDFPNLVTVSTLIDDVTMPRVTVALRKVFELNSAQAKKVADEERAAENPTNAAASSTGEPLTSELDASA